MMQRLSQHDPTRPWRPRWGTVRQEAVGLLSMLAMLSLSCAELASREPNTCGNGIIEPEAGEDCDGQEGCIAQHELSGCFWSCEEDAPCPAGFGCGIDGVCRAPGYDFVSGPTVGQGRVAWLQTADMDEDGRDDLIFATAEDGQTEGDLSVVFSGPDGTPADTVTWEAMESRVGVGDADGDGLPDILLTARSRVLDDWSSSGEVPAGADGPAPGFSVLRNDGRRRFAPLIIPESDSWRVAHTPREVWRGDDEYSGHPLGSEGLKLLDDDTVEDLESGEEALPPLPALTAASTAFDTMIQAGNCVSCGESFRVASITGAMAPYGPFLPEVQVTSTMGATAELVLQSVAVHPWIAFLDLNGDENLDVVTQTGEEQIVVAWGQPSGEFHSVRDEAGKDNTFGMPIVSRSEPTSLYGRVLVSADLNGDESPDFVMQRVVALSGACSAEDEWDGGSCCGEAYLCFETGVDWRAAVVTDIDGDDHLDVIGIEGGEATTVEIIRGTETGNGWAGPSSTWVGDGAVQLAVNDLDDDGLDDVLVRLEGEGTGEAPNDEIRVLWGDPLDLETTPILTDVSLHALVTYRGIPREHGFTASFTETLAVSGGQVDGGVALGLAGLTRIGDRVFAGVTGIVPEEFEAWLWVGEYHAVVAGHFSDAGAAEVALAGFTLELQDEGVVTRTISKVQTASLEQSWPGLFDVRRKTEWGAGKIPPAFKDPALPALTSMASSFVALDLDGDGRDELVVAGSVNPQGKTVEVVPSSGGFVAVYGQDGDAWTLRQALQDFGAELNFGGEWPYVRRPRPVEVADIDADGDLDVFLVGADDDGVLRGAVVLLNANGKLEPQSDRLSPAGDPWRAVSLLGPGKGAAERLAIVTETELQVGPFDAESMSFEEVNVVPVLGGQAITASGDFNGDGLRDLALGTENGVQLYFGTATHLPE